MSAVATSTTIRPALRHGPTTRGLIRRGDVRRAVEDAFPTSCMPDCDAPFYGVIRQATITEGRVTISAEVFLRADDAEGTLLAELPQDSVTVTLPATHKDLTDPDWWLETAHEDIAKAASVTLPFTAPEEMRARISAWQRGHSETCFMLMFLASYYR